MPRYASLLTVFLALTSVPTIAQAIEPWSDPDPPEPPERYEIGAVGVKADAEYRAQLVSINPIALNEELYSNVNWLEHRLRLGTTVDYEEKLAITVSMDVLDGVLWGDNGTFTEEPKSDSGLQVTSKDPNVVKPCIAYRGGDPLSPSGYGYALCEADILKLRRLYGQVTTPIGVLRIGRQAAGVGMGVQSSDGEGRRNRFGVAGDGDSVDRLLFATKPLEAFKPAGERNTNEDEGLLVAGGYDRWVSDSVYLVSDDVHQFFAAIRYGEPEIAFLKEPSAQLYWVYRWNSVFSTYLQTLGVKVFAKIGDFSVGFDNSGVFGKTREVSEAYSLITSDPVYDQTILQYGARGVVRFDQPMWGVYFEVDYASGDPDPQSGTNLSQFRFAEDTNVGLLLFDHIVRYQSARAGAAGVEIVKQLGAESFPPERVDTRGAFTNAFALFPQVDFKPHEDILFRAGVLFAWAAETLYDPVATLQAKDGISIEDDFVNFVGGKPGSYYGTEIDGRFQWRFIDHFAIDIEGAVLFPGDALEDVNGRAVNSFMTQGRTTFFF